MVFDAGHETARRRAAIVLALVAGAVCGCAALRPKPPAPPVLRVATSGDYAPFSLTKDGELQGLDIDVARRLAADLGMQLQFITLPWSDLDAATQHGTFDVAMGGVTMRADRALIGRYTRPYAGVGVVLLVREAYAKRFSTVAALDQPGVRIAVNAGGHLERIAREQFPHARIDAIPDNLALPKRLLDGRADALVSDTAEARDWLRSDMRVVGPFRFDYKAYLLPAPEGDLAKRIDDWLVAREADGWLATERAQWLGLPASTNPAAATRESIAAFIGLRLDLMPRVAAAKRAAGMPIVDKAQEARVIERVRAQATHPDYVEAVYRQLIELAIAVQNTVTTSDASVPLDALRGALERIDGQLVRELDHAPGSQVDRWRNSLSRTMTAPGIGPQDIQRLAEVIAKTKR
jgi:cyclohexadienyl dehydratase